MYLLINSVFINNSIFVKLFCIYSVALYLFNGFYSIIILLYMNTTFYIIFVPNTYGLRILVASIKCYENLISVYPKIFKQPVD